MTLLVQSGDRSAALQQFEQCRTILAEELAVEPGAMTLDLVDRIRNGTLARIQPVQDTTLARTAQQVTGQQVATTVEFPLVGREAEWQIARTIWQTLDQPQFLCIGCAPRHSKRR
jgi:DNA-binding SARP family transcriptional activator